MSAEPRQVASAEFWTRWEHQVVNGVFPLRRLLGCSDRTAVFLTEHKAKNLPNAAIKLVRTDGLGAKAQLKQWKAAAALSHPHLVSLFEMGRWRPGRREFVFLVMEYAEQTLDQILSQRALTADEVRGMLPPTLDALEYLHRNKWVHGQLRPSNFLAVNDQLKLASENVRPAGHSDSVLRISLHDPPELAKSGASAAGDVWGFGMTLVQALTRATPSWPDQRSETATLPANLPAPFVGLVRRCLSRTPANRPTVIELEAPFKTALRANSTAADVQLPAPAPTPTSQKKVAPPQPKRKRNLSLLTFAATFVIVLFGWMQFLDKPQAQPQATTAAVVATPVAPPPPVVATTPEPIVEDPAPTSFDLEVTPKAVLYEAKPSVPQDLSEKIRGAIDVTLRVLVDPSGDVMAALMENPGRNKTLARLADAAARDWKFAETEDKESTRVWLLRFEFTRDGVTASATEQ
jgi:serine/threonine-protein kinase